MDGDRTRMAHQLETRMPQQVPDVALCSREEVIEACDLMPLLDKALTQMRA
jgi:hypothetical protein